MRRVIVAIEKLFIGYSIGIIFLYSILLAEFFSTFLHLYISDYVFESNIFKVIIGTSYVANILSGFIIWIIYALLFHLTATLCGGQATFKRFLFVSPYPYIISTIMVLAGIFLLDDIEVPQIEDITTFLMNQPKFKLAVNLINYSFWPYYLIVTVFIRHIYQIKYIYAALSVAIPVVSIWAITELFKLL